MYVDLVHGMGEEVDVKQRIDLASKYLEEGMKLADKDPVQASGKLYKAAEEAVKVLAVRFGMEDILKVVGGKGGWTVIELEEVVSRISKKLGGWFKYFRGILHGFYMCGLDCFFLA